MFSHKNPIFYSIKELVATTTVTETTNKKGKEKKGLKEKMRKFSVKLIYFFQFSAFLSFDVCLPLRNGLMKT